MHDLMKTKIFIMSANKRSFFYLQKIYNISYLPLRLSKPDLQRPLFHNCPLLIIELDELPQHWYKLLSRHRAKNIILALKNMDIAARLDLTRIQNIHILSHNDNISHKLQELLSAPSKNLASVNNSYSPYINTQGLQVADNSSSIVLSKTMQKLFYTARSLGSSSEHVMITGESGVGKELLARYLYEIRKPRGQFIEFNCSSIADNLTGSELFGSKKGAYTDAIDKPGFFNLAHDGDLFLDEIGELSQSVQVSLLRVVETGNFYRVGSTQQQHSTARIICASNRNLKEEVKKQNFRLDLYYRLSIFHLHIPALRDRREDIPYLTRSILAQLNSEQELGKACFDIFNKYSWPGNIRELRNVLIRAIRLFPHEKEIRKEHLIFDDIDLDT